MIGQLPVSKDLPRHPWLEWGPAVTSNNSCNTLGWISPGLMILWTVRWYSWPLKISVHKWRVTVPAVVVLQLWGITSIIKGRGEEKSTEYLQFFCVSICQGTNFSNNWSSGFFWPSLAINMLYKSFLVVQHNNGHFQLLLSLHAISSCVCKHLWFSCKFWSYF